VSSARSRPRIYEGSLPVSSASFVRGHEFAVIWFRVLSSVCEGRVRDDGRR
jgi:hypothetical protein